MKKILWLSLVGVLCSSTTGCMFDYIDRLTNHDSTTDTTYSDPYASDYSDPYSYDMRTLEIDQGYLAGAMGDYRDFTAETYEATGYAYGTDSTTVELNAGDGYWVMARLDITGDLTALEPGTHLEFDDSSYDWSGSSDPSYTGDVVSYVNVTGCSGPSQGDWRFDQGSTTVTMDVEQGVTEADRQVYFEATYDNGGEPQTVNGSFGYTVY